MRHRTGLLAISAHRTAPLGEAMPKALAIAATVVMHLLVLLALTRPRAPRAPFGDLPPAPSDALRIRWVRASPSATPREPRNIPPSSTDAPARAARRVSDQARSTRASAVDASTTGAPSPAAPLRLSLPEAPRTDYIPGGEAHTARLTHLPPSTRVPGTAGVPHAPVFRMTDPRMQGVGGLVHFIGSLAGAVDPRCIDLDQWRHLSRAQRGAQHVSDADMADAEHRHHCMPPPPRVGPGINPLVH